MNISTVKQIVKRTLIYLVAGLIFMIGLSTLIYSIDIEDAYVYYEDDQITHKINYYKANEKKFNTLFIGTSRIYRQVDPVLFDSLSKNTNSYNAAHANLRPYRSFDYIDYLELGKNCENVFIELIPPSRIGANYNANPEIYSINYDKYFSILDFAIKSNYPLKFKAFYAVRYTQVFLYKYLGFGLKKYLGIMIDKNEPELEPLFYDINSTKGFLPFAEELKLHDNKDLEKRRNDFIAQPEQILEVSIRQSQPISLNNSASSDAYIEYIQGLEKRLSDQNIDVFFIVTPRRKPWDLAYITGMKDMLKSPVIDLSSPDQYPQFYEAINTFDQNHLNALGAQHFTIELHNAFEQLKK